jgi:hypothetical protein
MLRHTIVLVLALTIARCESNSTIEITDTPPQLTDTPPPTNQSDPINITMINPTIEFTILVSTMAVETGRFKANANTLTNNKLYMIVPCMAYTIKEFF